MKKEYLILKVNEKKERIYLNKLWKELKPENNLYIFLTDIFFYEDIYSYNKYEYFIDITNYQELYNKTIYQLAQEIKNKIKKEFDYEVTIGMGPNLFLATTACIKNKNKITYLDEKEYIMYYSNHKPLSDFIGISNSMMKKLEKLGINTMKDIRMQETKKLYDEFGLIAENLITHALGQDITTIKELNSKKTPKTISSSLTLKEIKTKKEVLPSVYELLDFNILKLLEEGLNTKTIKLYISYANNIIPTQIINLTLEKKTSSYSHLKKAGLLLFEKQVSPFFPIKKIAISFNEISKIEERNYEVLNKEKKWISLKKIPLVKINTSIATKNFILRT